MFLKDLGANQNVYQDYGWKNTGVLFKAHLLSYLIQFLMEELDRETKPDGTVVKITYGIERVPDIMALVEMAAYQDGLNVDRLVALAALISFAKIQESNRGFKRRIENTDKKHLQKSENLYKLPYMPFSNMNRKSGRSGRTGFKNLR
jgi:hypothetical protein